MGARTGQIRFKSTGMRGCIDDLRSIADAAERAKPHLDALLDEVFVETQRDVHVVTGALQASGKRYSEMTERDEWTGTVEYGEGVPYAVYELNKKGHTLDAVVASFDERFEEVLIDAFLAKD